MDPKQKPGWGVLQRQHTSVALLVGGGTGRISCLDADLGQRGHLGLSQEDQGGVPEEGIWL